MDKIFVFQGVANKLWSTENAMDAAIAEASKLMGGIVEAREELQCAHSVADPSMRKVADALAAMAQARTALIEAHGALNEAKLRMGVRTKMVGTAPKFDQEETVASLERRAG